TDYRRRAEIEQELTSTLEDWQLHLLPRIDLDILQIAVAEMRYLDIPHIVSFIVAIDFAKCYSVDDGFGFINGVLRRVTNKLNEAEKALSTQS
ncbi:MAG: transcription antitermination factor NusB, partial [Microcystis panniformis]